MKPQAFYRHDVRGDKIPNPPAFRQRHIAAIREQKAPGIHVARAGRIYRFHRKPGHFFNAIRDDIRAFFADFDRRNLARFCQFDARVKRRFDVSEHHHFLRVAEHNIHVFLDNVRKFAAITLNQEGIGEVEADFQAKALRVFHRVNRGDFLLFRVPHVAGQMENARRFQQIQINILPLKFARHAEVRVHRALRVRRGQNN